VSVSVSVGLDVNECLFAARWSCPWATHISRRDDSSVCNISLCGVCICECLCMCVCVQSIGGTQETPMIGR
jgi:hypothetical protein